MSKKLFAITIDLCEHLDLFEMMNQYELNASESIEEQVKGFADNDVAPLVRVYAGDADDFETDDFYKEFTFEEYTCSCKS